jgi:hypothetical protein
MTGSVAVSKDGRQYRFYDSIGSAHFSGAAVNFERKCMLTLVGIFMVVVVALLSNKEQRKGAWLLAAVVIVLVLIVDWMR